MLEDTTPEVVGVDLSGRFPKSPRHTAIAWLSLESPPRLVALEPPVDRRGRFIGERGDQALLDALAERPPQVVAVDSPLTLPHVVMCDDDGCMRCLPDDGAPPASYTKRDVDTAAYWTWLPRPPMSTAQLAAMVFRARWLARAMVATGLPEPIETYPMAVYRRLAMGTDAAGKERLETQDRWGLLDSQARVVDIDAIAPDLAGADDRLDAVAAAYVAWCHHRGRADDVRGEEGTIWIPQE